MTKRAQRPRYTKQAVLRAIENTGGIVSSIAQRLSCDWNTARRYIDRWQETRDAYQAERERVSDLAETTLINAIRDGDVGAAKWYLSRIARDRGYGDAVDLTTGGESLKPVAIIEVVKEREDDG